jgi:exodeoxyribonuclease-3
VKIATWNINGIKARIDGLLAWLEEASPDIVCLQEIKSVDENFPSAPIEDLGYQVATHGQKAFNGVALLSKNPLEDVSCGLPGDADDEQARFIEAVVSGENGIIRIAGAYMPNGNPVDSPKLDYKLAWMDRLQRWAEDRIELEEPLVIAGDYNIIPEPADAKRPDAWVGDALFLPESRQAYRQLIAAGLVDAIRSVSRDGDVYTFWDYQAGAWQKNNGIRIDHLLLSPEAADCLVSAGIDRHVRAWEKPSDHVPVWIDLAV